MPSITQRPTHKKSANLSVNAELLNQARALDINLSATLEAALIQAIQQKRRARWLEENREAIAQYNQDVTEHGVFSDGVRGF
ncbi:antitoxin [Chitiniphilus shinanonensis]|uniref:Antitoxin n=1 Tax=Chitiniphilus shinanonensis TaxID=553088 RepID=A0ABQ6BQ71_9NEIS|nr:type II toxin-antitoxin system CcdA family antitoxin [Chitiniphilus shinanonensis]GLS03335.1 antitoxin [Chitiniphilus shinanonensis]